METHVREENTSSIIQSVVLGWRSDDNYLHSEGGRVWVVRDPTVSLIVYAKSAQSVTCGVFIVFQMWLSLPFLSMLIMMQFNEESYGPS